MNRWLKFNAVGLAGAGVQLSVLAGLNAAGLHYLLATAIAVESAILHNYAWHRVWTWKDRPGRSLWRFHLANGVTSMISNLVLMRLLAGWLELPVATANLTAIMLTSLVNFLLGDRWVFAPQVQPGAVQDH